MSEGPGKVAVSGKSRSPAEWVFFRFSRNRVSVVAFVVLCLLFVTGGTFFALGRAQVFWPHDPDEIRLDAKLLPPSSAHWLGTDNLGRDVFSRILHGTYISLTVGFVAIGVSMTIGVTVGAISGYFGGWVDNVLMRDRKSVV